MKLSPIVDDCDAVFVPKKMTMTVTQTSTRRHLSPAMRGSVRRRVHQTVIVDPEPPASSTSERILVVAARVAAIDIIIVVVAAP
jgi:hypothetical protein